MRWRLVEVEHRRKMALAMRRFASRRIGVDTFEACWDNVEDEAASEIGYFAWLHYDDFKTTKLDGRWRLSPSRKHIWARCVLYLLTSRALNDADMLNRLEREHKRIRFKEFLWRQDRQQTSYESYREELWPFASLDEFEAAKRVRNPFSIA